MATPKRTPALPPALARQDKKRIATHVAQLKSEGEALVALVDDHRRTIARSFYEIGTALTRLHDPAVQSALGIEDYLAWCHERFGFSPATVHRLIRVARRMEGSAASSMDLERCLALIELSDALGETTPPGALQRRTIALPEQRRFVVREHSAHQIHEAARRLRDHAAAHAHHGRHAATAQSAIAVEITRGLQHAGVAHANVKVVTKSRAQVDLVLRVPVEGIASLAKVLAHLATVSPRGRSRAPVSNRR